MSVGYRVPREWGALSAGSKGFGSLAAFQRASRAGFLSESGSFVCGVTGCYVCGEGQQAADNAAKGTEEVAWAAFKASETYGNINWLPRALLNVSSSCVVNNLMLLGRNEYETK